MAYRMSLEELKDWWRASQEPGGSQRPEIAAKYELALRTMESLSPAEQMSFIQFANNLENGKRSTVSSRGVSNELLRAVAEARIQATHARSNIGGSLFSSSALSPVEDATLEVIEGMEALGIGYSDFGLLWEQIQPQGRDKTTILRYAENYSRNAAKLAKENGFTEAARHFNTAADGFRSIR